MYSAHEFDPRIPLHRRSLRKLASISAEDAVRLTNQKYDAAAARDASAAAYDKARSEWVKGQMKPYERANEARRAKEEKRILAEADKDPKLKRLKSLSEAASKSVDPANKAYTTAMDRAQMPGGNAAYFGLTKDEVQAKLPKDIKGADLSKIHSSKLTMGQNLRALGHDAKQLSYTPNAILKRGWEASGEGGGGWAAGPQTGRYLPIGAKSFGVIAGLGDLKATVNRSDPMGEGRSRTERLGYAIGGTAGGLAGSFSAKTMGRLGWLGFPAAIVGGIGGMMGGAYVGGKAGSAVDKLVSRSRGVSEGDYVQSMRGRRGV